MNVVEIPPDCRQRIRENGLIEGAHEGGQQHAQYDQHRVAMVECLVAVGIGIHGGQVRPGSSRSIP
jgi:hypothetical protein